MSDTRAAQKVPVSKLLGRFWTAANMLSVLRLLLVFPITYLIWVDGPLSWTFTLVGLGILTDFFDGRVARWSGTVSSWGMVLDPLADKAAAILITLALVFREATPNLPLWLLLLIVVRDVTIVLGGVMIGRRKGLVVMSVYAGKLAVNVLTLTVLAALLKADPPIMNVLVLATGALLVYSYLLYVGRFIRLMRGEALPDTLRVEDVAVAEPPPEPITEKKTVNSAG